MQAIEENIPIPKTSQGRPRKYKFYYLEIGQSTYIPNKLVGDFGTILAGIKGKTFTRRTVKNKKGEKIGVRVWRTS